MTDLKPKTRVEWLKECANDFARRAANAKSTERHYLNDASGSALRIALGCRDGPMFSEHYAEIFQQLIERNANLRPMFRKTGFEVGLIAKMNSL